LLTFEKHDYEYAIRLHLEILLLFARIGAAPLIKQAQNILAGFREQMEPVEFDRISQATLKKIADEGISWGRHKVVSAEDAQAMLTAQ